MRIAAAVVFTLLLTGMVAGLSAADDSVTTAAPTVRSVYSAHAPVRINSDSDPKWSEFPGRIISGYEINGNGSGYCLYIGNCTQGYTVENCRLYGASERNDVLFSNAGLYLFRSPGGRVMNNSFDTCEYGLFISYSDRIAAENNNASSNKNGVYLERSKWVNLTGGSVYGNSAYGISMDTATKNNITGINAKSNKINGIRMWKCEGNHMSGIKATTNKKEGIYLAYSNNNRVDNSSVTGNANGIYISGSGCTIADNTLAQNSGYGVNLWMANSTRVTGNTCQNNYNGVSLCNATKNIIKANYCTGNGYGIHLEFSARNAIARNNCTADYFGMDMVSSDSNSVTGNTFASSTYYGMWLDTANGNSILNNTFTSNANNGLRLLKSDRNTIAYNNITNSAKYGIYLSSDSGYNRLDHNNIMGNNGASGTRTPGKIQANDTVGTNFWNNSGHGNYWSDWTTPDANSDGIVDSPYQIDGNKGAKDEHPVTTAETVQEFPVIPAIIMMVLAVGALAPRKKR